MNDEKHLNPDLGSEFLGQYRTMLVVQLHRRIFRKTIQIEESRVSSADEICES